MLKGLRNFVEGILGSKRRIVRCRHGQIEGEKVPCAECAFEERNARELASARMQAEFAKYPPDVQLLLRQLEKQNATPWDRAQAARARLLAQEGRNANEIQRLIREATASKFRDRIPAMETPAQPTRVFPARILRVPQVTPVVTERPSDGASEQCWQRLGWWDFEIAVLLAFENIDYKASATPPMSDGGVDGIVEDLRGRAGVQCKHRKHNECILVDEVRAFIGVLHKLKICRGFFVTTGFYGKPALAEAKAIENSGIEVSLFTTVDLIRIGSGLCLSDQAISAAKKRWGVPDQPPQGMMPQGPRQRHSWF